MQPLAPSQRGSNDMARVTSEDTHWHLDIACVNLAGTSYYLHVKSRPEVVHSFSRRT